MRTFYRSSYTKQSRTNPKALGYCDTSGFLVRHEDMVKQYEFRGNSLMDTGFLVYPLFLDQPNPQNLTPTVKVDPKPIENPRAGNTYLYYSLSTTYINLTENDTTVSLTATQFDNQLLIIYGSPINNVIIYSPTSLPNSAYSPSGVGQIYVSNQTTGVSTISIVGTGYVQATPLVLPKCTSSQKNLLDYLNGQFSFATVR